MKKFTARVRGSTSVALALALLYFIPSTVSAAVQAPDEVGPSYTGTTLVTDTEATIQGMIIASTEMLEVNGDMKLSGVINQQNAFIASRRALANVNRHTLAFAAMTDTIDENSTKALQRRYRANKEYRPVLA